MVNADGAVLSVIERVMLEASVLEEIVESALQQVGTVSQDRRREVLGRELRQIEAELTRLSEALASGGDLPTLLTAIREREARREDLQRESHAIRRVPPVDVNIVKAKLRTRVADWRGLLRKHVDQGQQLIRRLVVGRLVMTPEKDEEGRYYRFQGKGSLSKLLAGLGPQNVASPTGFEPVFWP